MPDLCLRCNSLRESGVEVEEPHLCGDPRCRACHRDADPHEGLRYIESSRLPKAEFAGRGKEGDVWAARYMQDVPRLLRMIDDLSIALEAEDLLSARCAPDHDCPLCPEKDCDPRFGCALRQQAALAANSARPIAEAYSRVFRGKEEQAHD